MCVGVLSVVVGVGAVVCVFVACLWRVVRLFVFVVVMVCFVVLIVLCWSCCCVLCVVFVCCCRCLLSSLCFVC